jgi:hypothetical protein
MLIGATMIPGILSNRNPVPKLYKCPWRRIISPTYIRVVIIADTIAEILTAKAIIINNVIILFILRHPLIMTFANISLIFEEKRSHQQKLPRPK